MDKPPINTPHIVPPCQQQLRILQRHESFLIVEKPSGLLSVPGKAAQNKDSVYSRLLEEFPNLRIVHRLDLATSGLMLLALGKAACSNLNQQFAQRTVYKSYQAVVSGNWRRQSGSIEVPLICDWENRPRQKIDFIRGKYCLTHYQLLSAQQQTSRLKLIPITGRSHQLRLHVAAAGHPILGCNFYAHKQAFNMASRLLLHATQLRFKHPQTNATIVATSEPKF